jgi:ribosome-associated protein
MMNFDWRKLSCDVIRACEDKKAENTLVLDLRPLSTIADYLVIATANSAPQIQAVSDEIETKLKERGIAPLRRDGRNSGQWRVIDFGGIVVHIMTDDVRQAYQLEKFWDKADILDSSTIVH